MGTDKRRGGFPRLGAPMREIEVLEPVNYQHEPGRHRRYERGVHEVDETTRADAIRDGWGRDVPPGHNHEDEGGALEREAEE